MFLVRIVFVIAIVSGVEIPLNIKNELNRAVCLMECDNSAVCACDQIEINNEHTLKNNIHPPTLFCREKDFLTLKINGDNLLYALELKRRGIDWMLIKLFDTNTVTIESLHSSMEYKFRAWGISQDLRLFGPAESKWIKTLDVKSYPELVPNLYLKELRLNGSTYTASIGWNASTDFSCFYEFVWFGGDDISDYTQKEIRMPNEEFEMEIEGILFDSNYSVAVMTKSSDWSMESKKTWLHFTTPSCLEIYNSLSFCAPETPSGLQCEETLSGVDQEGTVLYNLLVSWNLPSYLPEYYTVNLMSFQMNSNSSGNYFNVSGDSTNILFKNIDVGMHYQITLEAWSDMGHSVPATFYRQIPGPSIEKPSTNWDGRKIILVLILPTGAIFLAVSFIIFMYYEISKRNRIGKRCQYFRDLEMKATQYMDSVLLENDLHVTFMDEWEVDPEDLVMQSILGQGAFGIVRRGWLKRDSERIEVAVKMLKDAPKLEELRQFQQEIEIMKSVGSHPNIVSMQGCCARRNDRGPLLIVEYCSRGDLLGYLRSAWETITSNSSDVQYADMDFEPESPTNFSNKLYLMDVDRVNSEKLQIKDLISIAKQISQGMEYLSSLRMLHRDLAARNVLICENGTIKVSDFGLSRDVYKDNVYCKTSNGKLPIRWMALESLTYQRYTTHSDVWSFGILLWEIVTLGGNPYPGVAAKDLLRLLKSGYRMDCPINCNNDLYSLMQSCWRANPKERPSFTDIRRFLDKLLTNAKSNFLNLAVSVYMENSPNIKKKTPRPKGRSVSFERYVKPLPHHFL